MALTSVTMATAATATLQAQAQIAAEAGNHSGTVALDLTPQVGVRYERRLFSADSQFATTFGSGYPELWSERWQSATQLSWRSFSQRLNAQLDYQHREQASAGTAPAQTDRANAAIALLIPQSAVFLHQTSLSLTHQGVRAPAQTEANDNLLTLNYAGVLQPSAAKRLSVTLQAVNYASGTQVYSSALEWQQQASRARLKASSQLNYSQQAEASALTLGGVLNAGYQSAYLLSELSLRRTQTDALSYYSADFLSTALAQQQQIVVNELEMSASDVRLTPVIVLAARYRIAQTQRLNELSLLDLQSTETVRYQLADLTLAVQMSAAQRAEVGVSHQRGDLGDVSQLQLSYRAQVNAQVSWGADLAQSIAPAEPLQWSVNLAYRL